MKENIKKEKNKKFWSKLILLVCIILFFSSNVFGLGILPASKSIIMDKDDREFSFFIVNDNVDIDLNINIEGYLSEYVVVDREKIFLSKNKDREEIKVKIKDLPTNVVPGEHEIRIKVSDVSESSSQISAKISLIFILKIIILNEEAYLDISLYAPNFKKNEEGNFVIQAQNKGLKNAVNVVPVIDIYSMTNNKIMTIKGDSRLIKSGERTNFALPLNNDLENGKYIAKAFLVYSGESNNDEKSFTVGSPEILVDTISTSSFRLGGIAGFDILLTNNWGEELNVFANIEFNKDEKVLWETTTSTTKIDGMSKARLQAFWDTSNLPVGTYDMIIQLNYLDKQDITRHQIRLESDKISVLGTGHVIKPNEKTDNLSLLIIVIFILVLLNVLLVYKFVIKKRSEPKK